jgi:hypothetical protein
MTLPFMGGSKSKQIISLLDLKFLIKMHGLLWNKSIPHIFHVEACECNVVIAIFVGCR